MKNTKSDKKLKVAVGMSGGVDSSVAAYLLLEQGYDVTGVFMQCWDARADGCRADEDKAYAVQTAAHLGIKFEQLDFRDEYRTKVTDYFYSEYQAGRTPNPDVMCNKEIKFGLFFDWAMKNGFDYVATGHYAQVKKDKIGNFNLLKGKDPKKDQSYFLYLLGQKQLAKTLFPVGNMIKTELRKKAIELKLPTSERPESMGICFIGEVDIKDFLKKKIAPKEGTVLSVAGEVIGTHEGAWYYTIGQRHGFRLTKYFGRPMYVVSKNVDNNTLVVGDEKDVMSDKFLVDEVHWIAENPFDTADEVVCDVRIRHLGKLTKGTLTKKNGNIQVQLTRQVFGVAPGQSVVFYKGGRALGGGIIQ